MRAVDLKARSTRELLALWAGTLRELKSRNVVRTYNSPIGDIAEELVALHYGGTRGSFDQKTWDVRVGDGDDATYLQVKAARRVGTAALRGLSPIRSEDGYDAVVAVVFTEDVRIEKAIRVERAVVNRLFPLQAHVNGRVIRLSQLHSGDDGVESITLSDSALDA